MCRTMDLTDQRELFPTFSGTKPSLTEPTLAASVRRATILSEEMMEQRLGGVSW